MTNKLGKKLNHEKKRKVNFQVCFLKYVIVFIKFPSPFHKTFLMKCFNKISLCSFLMTFHEKYFYDEKLIFRGKTKIATEFKKLFE